MKIRTIILNQALIIGLLIVCLCGYPLMNTSAKVINVNDLLIGFSHSDSIKVMSKVLQVSWCSKSNLKMDLELKFFNDGDTPVIISKNSGMIIPRFIIQSTLNDDRRKIIIDATQTPNISNLISMRVNDFNSLNDFIIIEPKNYYVTNKTIYASLGKKSAEKIVEKKNISLITYSRMWFDADALIAPLRSKWLHKGFLWSESLIAAPAPLVVSDAKTNLSTCN